MVVKFIVKPLQAECATDKLVAGASLLGLQSDTRRNAIDGPSLTWKYEVSYRGTLSVFMT